MAVHLAAPVSAGAQSDDRADRAAARERATLDEIEARLATRHAARDALEGKANALSSELVELRERLGLIGRSARDGEAMLDTLEAKAEALRLEIARKESDLKARRADTVQLLAALQRLALTPPEVTLFLERAPIETLRARLAVEASLPEVTSRAAALKADLADLADLHADLERRETMIRTASRDLARERAKLTTLINRKSALEQRTLAEAARTDAETVRLAAGAASLRDLIERIEREAAERRAAEAARAEAARVAALKRGLTPSPRSEQVVVATSAGRGMPVAGRIIGVFGARAGDGDAPSRGITIETRPGGLVVAPAAGRVIFAGPFRTYGQILILEHTDGYHSLLAGMEQIDTRVGADVVPGEPVGTMPSVSNHDPTLYFELRQSGQPVNPKPWLMAPVAAR